MCHESRSIHLIEIIDKVGCDEYISPRGSKAYLEQDRFFEISGIRLGYQDFDPQPYAQLGSKDFIAHLSIIDVLANIGFDQTREHIS